MASVTTRVADDLGIILGFGAVTAEVASLTTVVALHIGGGTWVRAFARHMAFLLAISTSDLAGLGTVGLAVSANTVS